MRDRETLMTGMNDLKLLLQYLYMDESHYVEVQNTLGVPLRIRMTDTCVFKVKNMNFPDVPEHSDELSIGTLLAITSQLRDVPAVEFPKRCNNRWDEIKSITAMQTSLNR